MDPEEKKFFVSDNLQFTMDQYLQSQRVALESSTTDVELILPDGMIPCHAAILQAVSPFFSQIFNTQGEYFPGVRQISMPDFSIQVMRKVIQLVYDIEACVESKSEADEIEGTVKLLNIFPSHNLTLGVSIYKEDRQASFLVVSNHASESTQPQQQQVVNNSSKDTKLVPLVKDSSSTPKEKEDNAQRNDVPSTSTGKNSAVIETRLKRRRLKQRSKDKSIDVIELQSSSSPSSSSSDEDDDVPKKRRGRPKKNTEAKTKEINNCLVAIKKLCQYPGKVSTETTTTCKDQNDNTKTARRSSRFRNTSDNATTSSTTTTKSNPSPVISSAKKEGNRLQLLKKLYVETKKCQKCERICKNPGEATRCLQSHSLVRCYFCFNVFENTEKLYEHFRLEHKVEGRENSVQCPFCVGGTTLGYKSVSSHVISVHLVNSENKTGESSSSVNGRQTSSQEPPPPVKKIKQVEVGHNMPD